MSFRIVATAYAIWLFAIIGVFYLVHGEDENSLQIVVIAGAVPALLQFFTVGVDTRGLVTPAKFMLALIIVILMSYLVNVTDPQMAPPPTGGRAILPPSWTPVVYIVNISFILTIALLIAGSPDRSLLRAIAARFCIITAAFLLFVDLTGEFLWGRLTANQIQPNFWGSMGLVVALTAFARSKGPLTIAAFGIGLFTIYLADSRSSIAALLAGLVVLTVLYLPTIKGPRIVIGLVLAAATLLATAILLDPYVTQVTQFISSDLMKLDNAERGFGSGFTGREAGWAETLDLWMKSPVFGVGFRRHESFLTLITSAHNAYLAMLADTGIVGLVYYVTLIGAGLLSALSIAEQRSRWFAVTVIISYIVYGFFERRAINTGNPYSLFFLLVCFYALAENQRHRAIARSRQALGRAAYAQLGPYREGVAEG